MKKATSHMLVVLCLLSVRPVALAASNVELNVMGKITPNACDVLLSDNGLVDHGKVPARSLNQHELSPLPGRQLEVSVNCDAPLLFVLVGVDSRADSSLGPGFLYGLGWNIHAPEERLGTISLDLRNAVADGEPALVLASSNQGLTWFPENNAYPDTYMGFAKPGTLVPEPHRLLVATLHINTSINAASFLTLNQEVPLDGAVVLDLKYL